MLGVAFVAIDALRALVLGGATALDLVGGSTYTDYDTPLLDGCALRPVP